MRQHRNHSKNIAMAVALLALPTVACGPTVFADTNALTIVGEPPPPPPPPPEPEPEPPPPEPKRVEVTAAAIVINDKILFETDKAVIRPESFDLMNEITQVVNDNPRIKKISIEGHTDDVGSKRYNKKLSQKRADSVMAYLTEHGVEAERLTAIGHGEETPLVENDSDESREKNRRVEFIIAEQEDLTEVREIDPETGEERVVETKPKPKPEPEPAPAEPAPSAAGPAGGATIAAPAAAKSDGKTQGEK